jgi:hypothetical protein
MLGLSMVSIPQGALLKAMFTWFEPAIAAGLFVEGARGSR